MAGVDLAKAQGAPACDAASAARRDYSWRESDVLGSGSYGQVYLAVHRATSQRVALKFVEAPYADSTWQREVDILRGVNHPNVIRLIADYPPGPKPSASAGSQPVRSAIMVFPVAHMDLRRFMILRAGPRLSPPLACSICRQILHGLVYLHGKDILHRDLKPSNVLVSVRCADDVQVWLCDLGMARVACVHGARPATPLVQTRGYRAPEVVARMHEREGPPLSSAMDMWSFGCCALEILFSQHIPGSDIPLLQMDMFVHLLGPCPRDVAAEFGQWADKIDQPSASAGCSLDKFLEKESPPAQHLVRGCLAWDPKSRLSAFGALHCAFFVNTPATNMSGLQSEVGSSVIKIEQEEHPSPTRKSDAGGGLAQAQGVEPGEMHGASRRHLVQAQGPVGYFSREPIPDAREVVLSQTKCACSGNCYQKGHRRHGCSSKFLCVLNREELDASVDSTVDGMFCMACICQVSCCMKPRYQGELCSKHKRIFEGLPPNVRILRPMSRFLPLLWPCDVTDFVQLWPRVSHDFPLACVLAMAKLPSERSAILAQAQSHAGCRVSAYDLYCALAHVCFKSEVSGTDTFAEEVSHLGRSGAMRTVGLAAVARFLGIAEVSALEEPPAKARCGVRISRKRQRIEWGTIGASGRLYRSTGDVSHIRALCKIESVHLEPVAGDKTFRMALNNIARFLDQVCAISPLGSYTRGYITRMFMLGHLAQTQGHIDWDSITLAMLKDMGPDQSNVLDDFPKTWSARQLSDFCFGRPDWGVFVAMFGCLGRDAVKTCGGEPEAVRLLEHESFERSAREYLENWGFCNHVVSALRAAKSASDAAEPHEEVVE